MLRLLVTGCWVLLLLSQTAPVNAQAKLINTSQLVNEEMTHPDDLFVGPAKMKLYYTLPFDPKRKLEMIVEVMLITRDQIVFREPNGRVASWKASENRSIELVQTFTKGPDRIWKKKTEQVDGKSVSTLDGPLVSPAKIDLSAHPLTKKQISSYLIERAEILQRQIDANLQSQNPKSVAAIQLYADKVKEYAEKQKIASAIVSLFDIQKFIQEHSDLYKLRTLEYQNLAAFLKEQEKQQKLHQAMVGLEQFGNILNLVARSNDYSESQDSNDLAATLSALGDIGKTAVRSHLEQKSLEAVGKVLQEERIKEILNINTKIADNNKRYTAQIQAAYKAIDLNGSDLGVLDAFVNEQLQNQKNPDYSSTIDVFNKRISYASENEMSSVQSIVYRNQLQARSQTNIKSTDLAIRLKQAEAVYQLGREIIEASRYIPDDKLFHFDRVATLVAGAKLIHKSVVWSRDSQNYATGNSAVADPKADYGARVLKTALSFGPLYDVDGHARLIRGILLLQRGLPVEALEQVKADVQIWSDQPNSMLTIARIFGNNKLPQEAASAFQKALVAGLVVTETIEKDVDFLDMWKAKPTPQFVVDKLKPNLEVSMTPNGNNYDIKIINNGSYPLVNATLVFEEIKNRNFAAGKPIAARIAKIEYLAPANSKQNEFIWTNVFQVQGFLKDLQLRVVLPASGGNKATSTSFPVQSANNFFYRPFWFGY